MLLWNINNCRKPIWSLEITPCSLIVSPGCVETTLTKTMAWFAFLTLRSFGVTGLAWFLGIGTFKRQI